MLLVGSQALCLGSTSDCSYITWSRKCIQTARRQHWRQKKQDHQKILPKKMFSIKEIQVHLRVMVLHNNVHSVFQKSCWILLTSGGANTVKVIFGSFWCSLIQQSLYTLFCNQFTPVNIGTVAYQAVLLASVIIIQKTQTAMSLCVRVCYNVILWSIFLLAPPTADGILSILYISAMCVCYFPGYINLYAFKWQTLAHVYVVSLLVVC